MRGIVAGGDSCVSSRSARGEAVVANRGGGVYAADGDVCSVRCLLFARRKRPFLHVVWVSRGVGGCSCLPRSCSSGLDAFGTAPCQMGVEQCFFLVVAAFLFIGPFIYLGSPESVCNELWLKVSPAYLTLLALFWVKRWSVLSKIKYAIAALCLLGTLQTVLKPWLSVDFFRYGVVKDIWNGHLNHSDPFLRQSVPPTREPLVPGILLREAGESERHFPGSLLPKAPGCDYTRPMSGNGN